MMWPVLPGSLENFSWQLPHDKKYVTFKSLIRWQLTLCARACRMYHKGERSCVYGIYGIASEANTICTLCGHCHKGEVGKRFTRFGYCALPNARTSLPHTA